MENNRDSRGCFTKGHPGMKPKGAISKSDREYRSRIEYVLNLIEENLEDEIGKLTPRQKMELWLHLLRYVHSKPPRINLNQQKAARREPDKYIFEVR
jgi:hypothetical protein